MVHCLQIRISPKASGQHGKRCAVRQQQLWKRCWKCLRVHAHESITYGASAQHVCFNYQCIILISKHRQHAHICEGDSDLQTLDGFFRCAAVQRSYFAGQLNLQCFQEVYGYFAAAAHQVRQVRRGKYICFGSLNTVIKGQAFCKVARSLQKNTTRLP